MKKLLSNILDWIVVIGLVLFPIFAIATFFVGLAAMISPARSMEKLATISPNPFIGDSTSNPFSAWNNSFNPKSPKNRFGPYGNPFSPYSANNPYATQSPGVYGYADEQESQSSGQAPMEYGGGSEGLGDYE